MRFLTRSLRLSIALAGLAAAGGFAQTVPASAEPSGGPAALHSSAPTGLKLNVKEYKLPNGLSVVLSPDQSLPIVAVEVLYHVGSAYEPVGRTGFAHLFEHLMFQGSLHYDTEYFTPFEPIGAEVNGTTNTDRTNYYEHVPREYAELALWMESDRMRSLLDVLTQKKLDNQREVVRNERRQSFEMKPYGTAHLHLSEALHPPGHPYRHSPIGSHEDLERATLDDVKAFFRKYYVPENATLVIAGDFDEAQMRTWIERYFGDIPGGSRAALPTLPAGPSGRGTHLIVEDQVQLPRIYYGFSTPALFAPGDAELDLLSSILSDGKTSRLYQTLVYERKLAKEIACYQMSRRLSGMYVIEAGAAPGVSIEDLGRAIEEELARALVPLVTEKELLRAKNNFKKDFFHRIESIGDRASLLAEYHLQTGHADALAEDYGRYASATAEAVSAAGRKYLAIDQAVRVDIIPGSRTTPVRTVRTGGAQ
jgi:zinc protease